MQSSRKVSGQQAENREIQTATHLHTDIVHDRGGGQCAGYLKRSRVVDQSRQGRWDLGTDGA